MNPSTSYQAEFAPPPEPARGRSFVLAAAAHVLLLVALGLVTRWATQEQVVTAEAELWSAVPEQAAPPRVEPLPPTPEPAQPEPAKAVPRPSQEPEPQKHDAEIALKKQKEEEKKKALEKEKAEKLRKEKLEKEKADKEKAEKEKKLKEQKAKEQKAKEDKEREKKKAEEKRKTDEAQAKADAARTEALRNENLKRMQGLAGAAGSDNSTSTAVKSFGPSVNYASKLKAKIGNIFYSGNDNPVIEVRVRATATGRVISITPVLPSSSATWNESVMSALHQRLDVLPPDADGRIHTDLVIPVSPAMINR